MKSLHICFETTEMENALAQVVVMRTIGIWPSKITEYQKSSGPANYTSHSFRRTSATILVNKGVDVSRTLYKTKYGLRIKFYMIIKLKIWFCSDLDHLIYRN